MMHRSEREDLAPASIAAMERAQYAKRTRVPRLAGALGRCHAIWGTSSV